MSHLIHGVQEQHYVGHVMQYASCVGRYSDNCDRKVTNPYVTCSKGYGLIYNKSVIYISLSIVLLLMFNRMWTRNFKTHKIKLKELGRFKYFYILILTQFEPLSWICMNCLPQHLSWICMNYLPQQLWTFVMNMHELLATTIMNIRY